MIKLAVTGSSGYLGQAILRALETDEEVERVIGLDMKPHAESNKTRFVQIDVRDPGLGQVLKSEGVQGILHLAFIIDAKGNPAWMRDVNINGTVNVLRAAAEAGVDRFVMMSSLAVYGAWPDNPVPLTEEIPPRPNADDLYGWHKMQAEWLCHSFAEAHPEVAVAIMRPCGVAGPSLNSTFLFAMRDAPFLPMPSERAGLAQFIHEEDAARMAILLAKRRARGTFNAAGDGTVSWLDVYKRLGKPIITLPRQLLSGLLHLLWRLKMLPMLPTQMGIIIYPMILSAERALRELGFRARYTTADAIEATLSACRL